MVGSVELTDEVVGAVVVAIGRFGGAKSGPKTAVAEERKGFVSWIVVIDRRKKRNSPYHSAAVTPKRSRRFNANLCLTQNRSLAVIS